MSDEKKSTPKKTTRKSTTRRSTTTARRTAAPSADAATTAVEQGRRPSYDEVRERAYFRYLERGGQHGDDQRDWFLAEQDLLHNRN